MTYELGSIAIPAAEPVPGSAANPVIVDDDIEGGEPSAGPSRVVVEGSEEESDEPGSPLPVLLVRGTGDLVDFADM